MEDLSVYLNNPEDRMFSLSPEDEYEYENEHFSLSNSISIFPFDQMSNSTLELEVPLNNIICGIPVSVGPEGEREMEERQRLKEEKGAFLEGFDEDVKEMFECPICMCSMDPDNSVLSPC
mmetsp:Transcript_18776/g.16624  ORF Transcript_18776/g.16624 Transcript_18776/m.16624 type:complete len:120 (-) Transcript_18776:186-545(-)